MSGWHHEVPTEGAVELPPDPRALDVLGRNHQLDTALADLVDNSIDATATHVLIRFVQDRLRLVGVYVVDNGTGIRPESIDAAMTVGGRREYSGPDLGTFGLGLKAASFSQAASLTVLARAAGHTAVGRRWLLGSDRRSFLCDKVPADFAAAELDRAWPIPGGASGTVVRWDRVSGFPAFDDRNHVDEFLSRTIFALQGHLGLMFHRILADGRVQIFIDVEDTELGPGLLTRVAPINPFGYPSLPRGWPKELIARSEESTVVLHCHIWPGRSNLPEYRLIAGAEQHQGLYFYRRNRLLQAGGWQGIHAADKKLQLARIAVDIDGDTGRLFVMNPEKSRVLAGPDFAHVVSLARADDGTTVADYLQAAELAWSTSNQRSTAKRKAVVPPGKGLHPKVRQGLIDELPQLNDPPLNILWRSFRGSDDFFEVDRETGTLWINQAYRPAMLGGVTGVSTIFPS